MESKRFHHCGVDHIRVCDVTVLAFPAPISWKERLHIINPHQLGCHTHPDVAWTAKHNAIAVAIFLSGDGSGGTDRRRLGHRLINDSIQLLPSKQVIVDVEEDGYIILHEQQVDRHLPAGTVLFKSPAAVGIISAPLVQGRVLYAASPLPVSSHQVVREDEFELCSASLQRLAEPLILIGP